MKKLKEIHSELTEAPGQEERFVVQMEFYIWAKDMHTAKLMAQDIAKKRREKFDDQAEITDVWKQPFGGGIG